MIQELPKTELFNQKLHNSLLQETPNSQLVKIAKDADFSTDGDQDEMIYFIESGQLKLIMLSPEGKECVIAVHTKGDVFGELCLSELDLRKVNAIAMEETQLIPIPYPDFLLLLSNYSLLEGFIIYLALRIANQQQIIAGLIAVDRETASMGSPHLNQTT